MKTTIKLLAFILAASFPCAAAAEILGARFPASLDAANLTGLFAILSIALLLTADYSRRSLVRPLAVSAAVPAKSRRTETHRLAA